MTFLMAANDLFGAGGGSLTNFALASAGSSATASASEGSGNYNPDRANNGLRNTNNNWGTGLSPGGGWDAGVNPSVTPQWLQIDFGATRSISEIDVFTLADAVQYTTDPTLADTFSSYGITDFKTQYWNGSAWVDINTVTGNNKVWRKFTFSPVSTTKIRVYITAGAGADARLVEVEAWG